MRARFCLALVAAAVAVGAASPDTSLLTPADRALLAQQGFPPRDFRDLDLATQSPSAARTASAWLTCTARAAAFLTAGNKPWREARELLPAYCTKQKEALTASLVSAVGADRGARAFLLLQSTLLLRLGEVFERAEASEAARAAHPAPIHPHLPNYNWGGTWKLVRMPKDECVALLTYDAVFVPSIYIAREGSNYRIGFRQRFSPILTPLSPDRRHIVVFYGERPVDLTIDFTDEHDDEASVITMLWPVGNAAGLRTATTIWIEVRPGASASGAFNSEFYQLPGFPAALDSLEGCKP